MWDTSDLHSLLQLAAKNGKALTNLIDGNKLFMFDKGCTFLAAFGLPGTKNEVSQNHDIVTF